MKADPISPPRRRRSILTNRCGCGRGDCTTCNTFTRLAAARLRGKVYAAGGRPSRRRV